MGVTWLSQIESASETHLPLAGKRVYLLGTLGGLTKRDSVQLLRRSGSRVVESVTSTIETIVVGNEDDGLEAFWLRAPDLKEAVANQQVHLLYETELWEFWNGQTYNSAVKQLYSPAMLADLLGIPVRLVRRWHRAGLIQPVHEVMQLPYFDYTELATARQLARWVRDGHSVSSIERQIAGLAELSPTAGRPIVELAITAEGKRLLLRRGGQLLESTGQLCFSFDETESVNENYDTLQFNDLPCRLKINEHASPNTPEGMIEQALLAEDQDELDTAVDWYRSALAAFGPNADLCFQLAELLYRLGDSSAARERYYMALEINAGLVEARANLGCVLAELGQLDLAISAFEGTLEQFEEYADVHFHLARALVDAGQTDRAQRHWSRFLELAPASPWAEEARQHLSQQPTLDL